MIEKTRGIVLRFTRYSETSIIVNVFTEAYGVRSYIVNSVRSSKGDMALYQPLTLLEMVVYHREGDHVMRIREKHCFYAYKNLWKDVRKAAIAMFLNEILVKTLREETHPEPVFGFISDSLILLDEARENYENFHLVFLIQLARQLGFGAEDASHIGDLSLDDKELACLGSLIEAPLLVHLPIKNEQRRTLLNTLLDFYSRHIHHLGEMKSLQILREMLS